MWPPGSQEGILVRGRARSKRLAQAAVFYLRYTKGRFFTSILFLILGQLITLTQEWRLPALPGGIHHFQSAVHHNGLN